MFRCNFTLFNNSINILHGRSGSDDLIGVIPRLPNYSELYPIQHRMKGPPPTLLSNRALPRRGKEGFIGTTDLKGYLPCHPTRLHLIHFGLNKLNQLSYNFSSDILFVGNGLSFLYHPMFPFNCPFLTTT